MMCKNAIVGVTLRHSKGERKGPRTCFESLSMTQRSLPITS